MFFLSNKPSFWSTWYFIQSNWWIEWIVFKWYRNRGFNTDMYRFIGCSDYSDFFISSVDWDAAVLPAESGAAGAAVQSNDTLQLLCWRILLFNFSSCLCLSLTMYQYTKLQMLLARSLILANILPEVFTRPGLGRDHEDTGVSPDQTVTTQVRLRPGAGVICLWWEHVPEIINQLIQPLQSNTTKVYIREGFTYYH